MEREKNFYQIFIMFLFVTCYITCYILANRIIEFGGFIATASSFVYPFTYFIAILFYERYGKNKTFELVNFTVVSLIFMGIIIGIAGTFDVFRGPDGLEKIFNIDFRMLFASIVAFVTGQYINIKIYDFLGTKKGYDFLVSGVIAITIDSFLFIGLTYLGVASFKEVICLATGQYVMSVIAILIYSLCFNSLIPTLLATKEKDIVKAKKSSNKKDTLVATENKKTTTRKTTTKKTSNSKNKNNIKNEEK